jgi:hypothetical protein
MAIPLTLARQYTRMGGGAYKSIKPKFFVDGDRREFPLEPTPDEITEAVKTSSVYKSVKGLLNPMGYSFTETQYAEGVASSDGVRHALKIGKILQGLGEETLLKEFKEDFCRSYGGLKVVISRHPYDIASMTTNRGWSSCMDLVSGCNKAYVKRDIMGRTVIAYLTSMKDKNLTNPLARILLKRYENASGHEYYVPATRVYGLSTAYFKPYLTRLAEKLNAGVPRGIYTLDNEFYYSDDNPLTIDTRSAEDIAEERRKKLQMAIRAEILAVGPLKEIYTQLMAQIGDISLVAFQDLMGTLKWKKTMGVIGDEDYRAFVTARSNLLDKGRSEYVKFIYDEIEARATNDSDKILTYWKFVSSFTMTLGSLLASASKFKDLKDEYYFIRTIDIPVSISEDDREIYDVSEYLDYISEILKTQSKCIQDAAEYGFKHILEVLTARHTTYENALLEYYKVNSANAQTLAYIYAYNTSKLRAIIEVDRNNDPLAYKIYNMAHGRPF